MAYALEQKLALTRRPNYLTFFNDRLFVKAYNESVFLLGQILQKKSPPAVFKMRHKPYELVIMQSIPKVALLKIMPSLQKTNFGYELLGDYDLTSYSEWFAVHGLYCGEPQ